MERSPICDLIMPPHMSYFIPHFFHILLSNVRFEKKRNEMRSLKKHTYVDKHMDYPN